MRTDQLMRTAIVGVLWLCLGAGCSKDPPTPDCPNGSCCWENGEPKVLRKLNGVRAEFGGDGFRYKDVVLDSTNGIKQRNCIVCPVQEEMLAKMGLKNNMTIENNKVRLIDSTLNYPYRVWGTVYHLTAVPNFLGIPTLAIRIDKVEEVR